MKFIWVVVFVCVKCSAMSRNELDEFADHLHRTSQLDLNLKTGADSDGVYDEDEEVSDHAWEDSGKFEGDLILNDRQRRLIVENVEGLSRNGLTDSTKRWPNNEVIYFIQKEHFNGDQVQAIQDGIEDLAQASCVKFRPYKKGDRDAVVIQGSRRGCFSQVGYQGGYQVLNLSGRHPAGRGCFRHGTVVHELLHTLGFYHMQSSPDRDDYIHVMWENIIQPARHNFRKYNTFAVSDFGVGYDYDSVLHYSRRAFSSNGKDTLVPRKNGAQIGQRVGLSDKDTQKLNKMYCDSDSNGFDADEIPTKTKTKKKKPKNQPFDGHGIGYHQGKTVIIKVPTSETYKLSVASPIQVFDFRGPAAPQAVPSPQTEDHYRFGKEITYPYKYAAETETPTLPKETVVQEEKPNAEEIDEDLAQAFDRLANIAKEKIYPKDYTFQINTDYSKFYTPKVKKNESPDDFYGNGKYKEMIIEKSPALTPNQRNTNKNPDESVENIETEDYSDSTYRTSLPVKKPYSAYTNTETPYYATREYLEGREKYSHLFSQEPDDKKEGYTIFNQKLPISESWYQKPSYQTGFGDTGNHSEEAESQEEYNQKLLKAPNKSEAYTFDAPIPLTKDWYKAHSIEPPPSYGEDSSSEINR